MSVIVQWEGEQKHIEDQVLEQFYESQKETIFGA